MVVSLLDSFATPELTIVIGFYRGITPAITGSLATGATYFGVIESTKKWIEESHPSLGGHWAHFIAGAVGKLFFILLPKSSSLVSCLCG